MKDKNNSTPVSVVSGLRKKLQERLEHGNNLYEKGYGYINPEKFGLEKAIELIEEYTVSVEPTNMSQNVQKCDISVEEKENLVASDNKNEGASLASHTSTVGNSIEQFAVPVMIKCPECETIQAAIIEKTVPFDTYIHHCENCKHIIMESEWNEIKPFKF